MENTSSMFTTSEKWDLLILSIGLIIQLLFG